MSKFLSFFIQFILNLKRKLRDPSHVFEFHNDFIFRAQIPGKRPTIKIHHHDER